MLLKMAHPHRISDIWNHFSDNFPFAGKVQCVHCTQVLSNKYGSGNLYRHMSLKHKDICINQYQAERLANQEPTTLSTNNKASIITNRRKGVWKHYSKAGLKIICLHCSASISYKSGSTSNLLRHLRLKHKDNLASQDMPSPLEHENFETSSANSSADVSNTMCNRNKRSRVWNHFSSIGDSKAVCTHCLRILSTKSGNIGNLSRHMRMLHKGIPMYGKFVLPSAASTHSTHVHEDETSSSAKPVEFEVSENTVLNESITDNIPLSNDCKPAGINYMEHVDQQLLKMIVEGYHPFNIIEGSEFKKFINMLCPEYKIPSVKIISNNLLQQMFSSAEESLRNKLCDSISVCITIDSWTSVNGENFITNTAYWINSKTELCSGLLDCIILNEWELTNPLEKIIQDSFEKWAISHKIVAIVSDNTTSIVSAIKRGGWPHLVCFADNLNMTVQKGLVAIDNLITKIRKITRFFRSNEIAQRDLVLAQENMGLQVLKLKPDVPSYWCTTYKMLKRVLDIKEEVIWVFSNTEHDEDMELTSDEWQIAELAMNVLTIFNEVALEISGEKNVPLSKEILFIQAMKRYMYKSLEKESLPQAIHLMIDIFLNEIEEKFGYCEKNELIAESILLDPRFKKIGCENEEKYNALREKVCVIKVETDKNSQEDMSMCASTSYLWKEFDEKVNKHLEQPDFIQESHEELDKYMNEALISRLSDPFIWWEQRKLIYPRLYNIACQRLCIVATSVPCERFFSNRGRNLIANRNLLTSSKMNEIVCLHNNTD